MLHYQRRNIKISHELKKINFLFSNNLIIESSFTTYYYYTIVQVRGELIIFHDIGK